MSVLAPLAGPPSDKLPAQWSGLGLRWWLLRSDRAGRPAVAAALVRALDAVPPPGVAWVAAVEGSAEEIRYVLEVVGAEVELIPAPGGRIAVLGPLAGQAAAAALVDAVSTAGTRLTLLAVEADHASARCEALRGIGRVAQPVPRLAVLWPPRASWALLSRDGDSPPVVGVDVHPAAERMPQVPGRRVLWPQRAAGKVAAVALGVAVLAAVGVALWVAHRGGAPRSPSAVAIDAAGQGRPSPTSTPPAFPAPGFGPSLAYDAARHQVVLFGGVAGGGSTWLWAAGGWTLTNPRLSPPGRFDAATAWDPTMGAVLLFGGEAQPGSGLLNDTWAWDGSTWAQVGDPGSAPPATGFASMAYDVERDEMLLIDGFPGDDGQTTQTWSWDGFRWRQRSARGGPPGPALALAFDPRSRTMLAVALASAGAAGPDVQTWSWDGSVWRRLAPAHQPGGSAHMWLGEDPGSGQLLLLPVVGPQGGPLSTETWTWDGGDWTLIQPAAAPGDIFGAVGDARDGLVVAFARDVDAPPDLSVDRAWAWTGVTWVVLHGAGNPASIAAPLPPPRQGASMAYDPVARRLVLFGGNGGLRDTWTWDGARWTEQHPTTPPPLEAPAVYDPSTLSVLALAIGGLTGSGATPGPLETWRWDGADWHDLGPSAQLPSSAAFPILLREDPSRRQVVAVTLCCVRPGGGLDDTQRLATWTWDGRRWTLRHPRHQLGGGGFFELFSAFDSRDGTVLAVASDDSRREGQTWRWDGADWTLLHPSTALPVDPVTVFVADDPADHVVMRQEARYPEPVTFENVGGAYSWDGSDWTIVPGVDLPGVNTAHGAAPPFFDPGIGRVVVIGGQTQDDFSQEWMWTGRTWLRITPPNATVGG